MRNNSQVTYHGAWGAPPIPKKPPVLPSWEEACQPAAKRKRTLGDILQDFAENTTAHGVPTIARSKRTVTKVFWLAVFLAMLTVFCWQGITVLVDYLGFPSTTKVKLVTNPELTFPSVTICNMNRLRRSQLVGSRFEGLIRLDGGLTDDSGQTDYSWFFDWDSAWYEHYMDTYGNASGAGQASTGSNLGTGGPTLQSDWSVMYGDGGVDPAGIFTQDGTDTFTTAASDNMMQVETTMAAMTDFPEAPSTVGIAYTGLAVSTKSSSSAQETPTADHGTLDEGLFEAGTGTGIDVTALDMTTAHSPPQTNTAVSDSNVSPGSSSEEYPVTDQSATSMGMQATTEEEGMITTEIPESEPFESLASSSTAFEHDASPSTLTIESGETTTSKESDSSIVSVTTPQSQATTGEDSVSPPDVVSLASSASSEGVWSPSRVASSGVGKGTTAASVDFSPSNFPVTSAPTSSTGTESEAPPARTTGTITGSAATQQLEEKTTTAGGDSRRKKRSLRIIRDTSMDDGIRGIIGEFGSWVDQEWNNEEGGAQFDFQYDQYFNWTGVNSDDDWQQFYDRSTSPDYSDFLDIINPTREELKTLGHQAKDTILQCTFDKKLCSFKDFHQFQNKEYGNCFTFNHEEELQATKTTKNSGAQYGLHLTLFLEMPEYVGILSPEAGIRVSIHSQTTPPFPEDDGITASPGMATNIGLRQVYLERLGKPYNTEDCQPYTATTYSRKSCLKECVQEEMFKRCRCVSDILLGNKTKCSFLNAWQQKCKQLVEYLGEEKKLNCDCPIACNETTYTKAVSSSYWPSERYEEHLQRRLNENPNSAFAARMATSEERTSKNLVRLRVYFEELNYQSILESPLYTFPNLLGNVGGLLGLYIGVSFLTLAEVIALIFHIIKHVCRKTICFKKVSPTPAVA